MKFFEVNDYAPELRGKNIIIGGRGIGKTYSALLFAIESGEPFIYLRNTDIQLTECCDDFGNPFKRLNKDKGFNISMIKKKEHALIYNDDNIIGYGAALSIFHNLRGVDLSDVKIVIFDEFIESRKLTFDQFKSFVHFYETVNRNRELLGEDPLKVIMLSNSQSINNPILIGYDLVGQIESMIANSIRKYKRDDIFLMLPESEISELKANTSHYKTLKNTKIYEEIINNKFANDSFYGIVKKKPMREYKCICVIDGIYIWTHKSTGRKYACYTQATNVPEFSSRDNGLIFYRSFGKNLMLEYAGGNLEFSCFQVKSKLLEILN